MAGAVSWPGVGLAVTTAVVLMFRGRSYTSATEAVPLVLGGATLLIGLITGAAVLAPVRLVRLRSCPGNVRGERSCSVRWRPAVSSRRCSAGSRNCTEYTVIALIVPLACWVAGLYSAVRGL